MLQVGTFATNASPQEVVSSSFHKQQERIFVERLFYLVLNHVELTNFSTFNVNSIIHLSKELEKYQRSTNKLISNVDKLNTIVQFVLSFSPSTITTFELNNLFYLLLNDMNDFSGKIIDRVAELLRIYHFMTYGHSITKYVLLNMVRSTRRDLLPICDSLLCFLNTRLMLPSTLSAMPIRRCFHSTSISSIRPTSTKAR